MDDSLPKMSSSCRLCGLAGELKSSHIVPRFVVNLVKGGSNGRLRSPEQPHLPLQDAFKRPLLCDECEQRFSRLERASSNFVKQCQTGAPPYTYSEHLAPFLLSVAWRVVVDELDHQESRGWIPRIARAVAEVETDWREALLSNDFSCTTGTIHAMVMDSRSDPSPNMRATLPANWNRYLDSAIDVTVASSLEPDTASSASQAFAYLKLGKLIAIAFIKMPNARRWKGTQVRRRGELNHGNIRLPQALVEFMVDRAAQIEGRLNAMSDKQRENIGKRVTAAVERGELVRALDGVGRDVEMFGRDRVFGRRTGAPRRPM